MYIPIAKNTTVDLVSIITFFGGILLILVVLVLIYFCVRGGECCWFKSKAIEEEEETECINFVGDDPESDDNLPYYENQPKHMVKPVYHQLKNEPEYEDFTQDTKQRHGSMDLLRAPTPGSVFSVRSGYISTDDDSGAISDTTSLESNQMPKKKQREHAAFVDGTRIRLSFLYAKTDMFLMLTINEVDGIPSKENGGFDYLRVSVTLFPKKKYKSKTKYVFVKDSNVSFDESFKFSNVNRDSLFNSAFRLRLQGKKHGIGKGACLGEAMVQLADVAQRSGGFMTWKTFEKTKR